MSAKDICMVVAKRCDLTVCAVKSEGGRSARSRAFDNPVPADQCYYGPRSAIYHASDWQEMLAFLHGYESHMRLMFVKTDPDRSNA